MKSIITQSPYEAFLPGSISSGIARRFNFTNVYYFTEENKKSSKEYIDTTINFEPLFHNHDYSRMQLLESIDVPSEIYYKMENYKSKLMEVIMRWRKNYKNFSSMASLDVLYFELLSYWYSFLVLNNVQLVILWLPHGVDDTFIYYLSKILNLKIIIEHNQLIYDNKSAYRMIVTNDKSELILNNNYESDVVLSKDLDYIFRKMTLNKSSIFKIFNDEISEKPTLIKIFNYINYILKRFFAHILKRDFKILLRKLIYLIKLNTYDYIFRLKLIRLNDDRDLSGFDYYYFPLHLQPEATTSFYGGLFSQQLLIIDKISKNLPLNVKLLVKEHPAYFKVSFSHYFSSITETRSFYFYNLIKSYSNVVFISKNYDSSMLIEKSLGVITVNGSVAVESIQKKKKVLIFGDHYYKNLPNCYHFHSEEDLELFFSAAIPESLNNEFYEYLNRISHNSYILHFGEGVDKMTLNNSIKMALDLFMSILE
jgi:hypothetical protein